MIVECLRRLLDNELTRVVLYVMQKKKKKKIIYDLKIPFLESLTLTCTNLARENRHRKSPIVFFKIEIFLWSSI